MTSPTFFVRLKRCVQSRTAAAECRSQIVADDLRSSSALSQASSKMQTISRSSSEEAIADRHATGSSAFGTRSPPQIGVVPQSLRQGDDRRPPEQASALSWICAGPNDGGQQHRMSMDAFGDREPTIGPTFRRVLSVRLGIGTHAGAGTFNYPDVGSAAGMAEEDKLPVASWVSKSTDLVNRSDKSLKEDTDNALL